MAHATHHIFLDDGDVPTLTHVWTLGDDVRSSVRLTNAATFYAPPRTLRAFAEALVAVADEACRLEDQLTDVPLFDDTDRAIELSDRDREARDRHVPHRDPA